MSKTVKIIGAGLAGTEASYQLSKFGYKVKLIDIKPNNLTPCHKNKNFAELVCSNSLKSDDLSSASGLLKEELRQLGSLCISIADKCRVEAGNTLAVDREKFSLLITDKIKNDKNIELICKEEIDFNEDELTIIASGPLTTPALLSNLEKKLDSNLHFFDAVAPIISFDSIDFNHAFIANRYNKGEPAYINCPLNKQEYQEFITQLINAQCVIKKDFEKGEVFESCMPIEIMAKRGENSLRFGPLKPVGLIDNHGNKHYAVVQLRRENAQGDMYNIVGFQTNLTFLEQKRVFSLIPALKNAEFLRFGVMHKNSFINAPLVINSDYSTKKFDSIYIAGQLSGVEGYNESILSGLTSAMSIIHNKSFFLPLNTISGALNNYLTKENKNFQPMNANFGLLPPLDTLIKDKIKRKQEYSLRAISSIKSYINTLN